MRKRNSKSQISNNKQIPNSKFKAVIFDLGDVYYKNGFKNALIDLCKSKGLAEKYLEDVFEKKYVKDVEVDKITERDFWREFDEDIPIDIKVPPFRRKVFSYFKPNPGMEKLVRDLRKKIKVGLLTNNIKNWFTFNDKKKKVSKNFDAVVVSARIKIRKPCREIYKLMAEKLNVKPSECVFFDDMIRNVEGAKKAGMMAYQFKSAGDCRAKLNHLGIL